jgi:GT2 family glycosyltransferase
MIDLSILIVSWNTRELLAGLLASLTAESIRSSREIIVVDNDSQDGSPEMVATQFPEVTLIRNKQNVGFARANNQAIAKAQGRYVLLLNSDTIVSPRVLEGLIDFMETHVAVGVCSPRLLTRNGTPQPFAFGGDPSLAYLVRRGVKRLIRRRPLHDWGIEHTADVDWVSGACLLLRREALLQVQGLDEEIFLYFEDVDLCRRIRQQGWRICYVPALAITHLGGQSLQQNPAAQRAYQQSLKYFYTKHYGPLPQKILDLALAAYNLLPDRR